MTTSYFNLLPSDNKKSRSAKEIRDWDVYLKTEFPIRYQINKIIHRCYCWGIRRNQLRLQDIKYWFLYRFSPKHRYNKIDIKTCPPGYYDPCHLMLHAPFAIFVKFMDSIYDGKSFVQWKYDITDVDDSNGLDAAYVTHRIDRWTEMELLYNWWVNIRPTRREDWEKANPNPHDELPEEWGFLPMFNDDFRGTPEVIAWKEYAALSNKQDAIWAVDDDEMLIRLMKIRNGLWD